MWIMWMPEKIKIILLSAELQTNLYKKKLSEKYRFLSKNMRMLSAHYACIHCVYQNRTRWTFTLNV